MATVRKRGKKYQAQVRIKGHSPQSKSFLTKAAALAWTRRIESSMDNGSWIDTRGSRSVFIEDIVDDLVYSYERFGLEVAGPKLGQLNQIKEYFHGVSIHDLTFDGVLDFAAFRLETIAESTLQAQMYYLKQAVTNSRIKTELPVVDMAIDELKKKKLIMGSKRRDRRLEPGEYEALMDQAAGHWISAAIDLAVESAMRQGEIHALKWSDINESKGVIRLMRKDKHAKTGQSAQQIPLLKGVREALLRSQNVFGQGPNLIPVERAASISDKFAKMTKKLGIDDLRFHDLRHEAISRLFEKGMRVEQVRVVSGHRTLDQLSRYVNLRPADLAGM
ncbi:site-specific integrase [bacterium]|nr:site-specific integrase [bacterium]